MELYDKKIRTLLELAKGAPVKNDCRPAKLLSGEEIILRTESAFELGGGSLPAVGGQLFTTDEALIDSSGVILLGKDLCELSCDSPYARFTLIRLKKDSLNTSDRQAAYRLLRRLDYLRYQICPEGYMMRISSLQEREPVRISKSAVKKGLSFYEIGKAFCEEYKKDSAVAEVIVLFFCGEGFDYAALKETAHTAEQITQSLDQIFKGLVMDCNACSQKELCDEIEGLRLLHQTL